jgi:hypothetical protein
VAVSGAGSVGDAGNADIPNAAAGGSGGARFENDWDVWLYPRPCPQNETEPRAPGGGASGGAPGCGTPGGGTPGGTAPGTAPGGGEPRRAAVRVCSEFDGAAEAALREGGAVLLAIPPERVRGDARHGRVELGFTGIFWNTSWSNRQAPHTLGILCDPAHPALAGFPTESHGNWQWWYIVSRASAMILDALPPGLLPVVRVVDDWFTNRKLALVFECRAGAGRLLVCSVDLREGGGANPVVRQLRASLLRYAAGADFSPRVELSAEQVRSLFAPR